MKENVLDVLMYLFENYMYDEPEDDPDRESLQSSLLQAGFSEIEINKAFEWLDGLADQRDAGQMPVHAFHRQQVFRRFVLAKLLF